jgi:FixJ family two-component response regulator
MIYIIGDDLSVRRALELILESAELKYVSFETAHEFLSAKNPKLSDLLVLDLNIIDTRACELLKKLWEEANQIPIIVITAGDDLQNMECCKKYGVKECLRKPVDGEALMDIIRYNLPHSSS